MKRRKFLSYSFAAGGVFAASPVFKPVNAGINEIKNMSPDNNFHFNLNYAPHEGMFVHHAGSDLFDQIKFMADTGFTAFEDNGMMERTPEIQEKIGNELSRRGMIMGVFVVDGGDNWKVSLTTGKKEFQDNFINTCRKVVEVAKRCNARWMTVVPGYFDRDKEIGYQTSNIVDILRRGAEIFEPHGFIMVLESLSDNPDLFLRTSQQGYAICKAVNSPSCKMLYDIYHMQRNEGDLISHIGMAWDEIGYIQIGDNPGRNEPNTGEINYKNIFGNLFKRGYKGVLGMEHGISNPGIEGEEALIQTYKAVDSFS